MRLVIRAKSLSNEVVSQTIVGEFDERGGTIGRSDSNTLTLPDPERRVSRLQAELTFAAGVFSVRNVGSSNPIIVNGRPLGPGEATALGHGDRMAIGGYELQVAVERAAPAVGLGRSVNARTVIRASVGEGRTPPTRRPTKKDPFVSGEDAFAGLQEPKPPPNAVDPFADLLDPKGVTSPSPAARPAPSSPAPAAARLPDDFDPFADLTPPGPTPAPSSPAKDETFSDLLGPVPPDSGSIDRLFDLGSLAPGKPALLDEFLGGQDTANSSNVEDPLAFLDQGGVARPVPVGPGAEDHTPELQGAYKPPPVRGTPPAQTTKPAPPKDVRRVSSRAPSVEPPAGDVDTPTLDALWDAFCDGARLRLPVRQRLTPDLMRVLGATLRHAVDGSIALSAVRTTAKQELLVPVTVIKTKNNNPLKFAPDVSSALAILVQPPMRGFMAGPEAMSDLMADLLGHAVGTMAGTRAAIQGMLTRFEPGQIEKQLAPGGVLDALLPMNRRARLWELYLEHFERISESAREDFQGLFGKAFVKAYEEQADRVAAARRDVG